MFKSQPIKLSKDLYYFKQEKNLKNPTDYAFILGGLIAEWGLKPIFEAQFDQMHVDLYILDWDLVIEVCGDRTPEQSKVDSNRDGFLVRNQTTIQRISNQTVSECIPPNEQIRLYFKGVNIYIQQLKDWKTKNSIPDYLVVKADVIFEDRQDLHQDLFEDINQWFH